LIAAAVTGKIDVLESTGQKGDLVNDQDEEFSRR
jgi:hypothetical protein